MIRQRLERGIFLAACWNLLLALAAYAQDGAQDRRFDEGGQGASDDVYDALTLPGGGTILGGYFTSYGGRDRWRLARLLPDGTLDPGFDPRESSGSAPVSRVAVLPDGGLLVGGPFGRFAGKAHPLVARLHADGSLDPAFNTGAALDGAAGAAVNALAVLTDGTVLVGGRVRSPNEVRGARGTLLVRLWPDGRRDDRFSCALLPQGDGDQAEALAVVHGGKILLGNHQGITRLWADGRLDPAFHPPPEVAGAVQALAVQPDAKILLAFSRPASGWRIVRLNPDGDLDAAFHPLDSSPENPGGVNALAALPDGRVLVGGSFRIVNGVRRHGLARLQSDGSLDTTFDPGTGIEVMPVDDADETPEAVVRVLLPLPDGLLLVAGRFDLYNGAVCHNVVRVRLGSTVASPPPPQRTSP